MGVFRFCWARNFNDLPARAERGRQNMLKYRPWLRGRIGSVENRIHTYLCMAKDGEATTGELARAVYCNPIFDWTRNRMREKGEPIPKLKSWQYARIRLAAPAFADRVGGGRGRKGYRWRLRENQYFSDVRDQKTIKYRQKQRARRSMAAAIRPGLPRWRSSVAT
jgi:hypothetical protein